MQGDVKVTIDYEKVEDDTRWGGLKGYLTNTDLPASQVYAAYHNLWHVERAFRISKSKIEIRCFTSHGGASRRMSASAS